MARLLRSSRQARRLLNQKHRATDTVIESLEARTLFTVTVAPLGIASNVIAAAADLGTVQLRSAHVVKGNVGVTSTDIAYKVEVTAEINLGLTLQNLLQKDNVYLLYSDGTLVNSGYQNSKPALKISQHLDPGTYYIDVQHGYVANDSLASGAAKVKVKPVKRYHIKATTGFVMQIHGLKLDDTIAPQEPIHPTGFAAAFGATGAKAEPTISAALTQQSGFSHYQAFTAAEGYQLWGANGPLPDDEIQQYIGDCYYVSVISSIARVDPGLIEQSIIPQADGTFVVKFHSNGQEVDEQVDDMLPVDASGHTVFQGIAADNAIWPAILEKAWCYFRPSSTSPGSYDGIQLGLASESLKAFGSTDATDIATNAYNTAPSLLNAISSKLQAGDLVDIGTDSPQNWPASDPPLPSGLFTGHAYSVVQVDVANSKIELRNPWATNGQGGLDGSNGYITISGDQLEQSIDVVSYGSLPNVTPNPDPTPTPTTPNPTPIPTTTTTNTQTIAENLGPNSYLADDNTNFDFFNFTANTNGQADISITSTAFTPELLIAQYGNTGWTTVVSNANAGGASTVDVKFTAVPGVTYGIGIFVSGTADTGAYSMTLNGDLSAPVQETPAASTGSLSGVVFNDANADGLQDNGETGLAGWSVFIDLNGTGQFADGDPITTTDANGAYTFTGLQPGTYAVYVEPTAGYSQTSPASGAGAAVTAGQSTTVAAFGEAQQGGGGISGTVYSDINADGSQDDGEPGLAGWYVFIDLGETGQYANGDPYVVTSSDGSYLFQGLTPGTYTTQIYPQSGFTTIEGATGWDNTVTASQSSFGGNFGEAQPTGTVAGSVYVDANADGAFDAGDAGLVNWQVYLDLENSGAYVAGDPVATTDGSGNYSFTGLAAGSYIVRVIPQSGYTTDEGSLGWIANAIAGQTSNGGSFGESQATGSLSGTVYDDLNRDGVQDGFESGVSNWAVYIDINNDGVYDTGDLYVITDSNGGYSFTGLAPGQYVVRAYVYTSLRWVAREGASGWAPTVVANQTSFGGNFGES